MIAARVPLYDDNNRIHAADFFGVWRAGDVVGVRIVGELTDARNPVWRAKVDELLDAAGWPRFMALDVRDAIPMASLPMRIQTALWGRRTLGKVERGVVCIGADGRVGVTVRAILRVAGMNNVALCSDSDDFTRRVAAMESSSPTSQS